MYKRWEKGSLLNNTISGTSKTDMTDAKTCQCDSFEKAMPHPWVSTVLYLSMSFGLPWQPESLPQPLQNLLCVDPMSQETECCQLDKSITVFTNRCPFPGNENGQANRTQSCRSGKLNFPWRATQPNGKRIHFCETHLQEKKVHTLVDIKHQAARPGGTCLLTQLLGMLREESHKIKTFSGFRVSSRSAWTT